MNGHEPSSPTTPYPLRAIGPVGKRITSLYQKRLDNFFTPGQWEKANLLALVNYIKLSGCSLIAKVAS
jgi:alpha-mannosidase